jgi:hypothetical protein
MEWDFAARQAELHKQFHLQAFAVGMAAGFASLGTVLLDKLPAEQGVVLAGLTFGIALYALVQLALLPRRMRRALAAATRHVEGLKRREER